MLRGPAPLGPQLVRSGRWQTRSHRPAPRGLGACIYATGSQPALPPPPRLQARPSCESPAGPSVGGAAQHARSAAAPSSARQLMRGRPRPARSPPRPALGLQGAVPTARSLPRRLVLRGRAALYPRRPRRGLTRARRPRPGRTAAKRGAAGSLSAAHSPPTRLLADGSARARGGRQRVAQGRPPPSVTTQRSAPGSGGGGSQRRNAHSDVLPQRHLRGPEAERDVWGR